MTQILTLYFTYVSDNKETDSFESCHPRCVCVKTGEGM